MGFSLFSFNKRESVLQKILRFFFGGAQCRSEVLLADFCGGDGGIQQGILPIHFLVEDAPIPGCEESFAFHEFG